jgi:hypothetical protein
MRGDRQTEAEVSHHRFWQTRKIGKLRAPSSGRGDRVTCGIAGHCPPLLTFLLLLLLPLGARAETTRLSFDREEIRFARDWYGIYVGSEKIGAASVSLQRKGKKGRERFVFAMEMELKVTALGQKVSAKMTEVHEFESSAPYRLLAAHSTASQGPFTQKIVLEREGDQLRAMVRTGGEKRKMELEEITFDFVDAMTPQVWIARGPGRGETLRARTFMLDDLEQDVETYEIRDVRRVVTGGVWSTFFDVEISSDSDEGVYLVRMDSEGRMLSAVVGGGMELRLESKRRAKDFGYSSDLFVMGMIGIDEPLGDPRNVTELVVEIEPELADFFSDGPRQSVERGEESGTTELRIGKAFGVPLAATEEEIRENLKETVEFPIGHERVLALVEQAVGDASTPREKVERLVPFVHGYLEDSYTAEPLTVFDILNVRKGDCTEYSMLFATMSRAAGVPTRIVSGLHYMGDDVQSFGGHAWNEVVLGGHWMPVDASWDELQINATHIKIEDDLESEIGFFTADKGQLELRDLRRAGSE